MDKKEKDIDAVLRSMKHWLENALGQTCDTSAKSCALCTLYFKSANPCGGCPIALYTNKILCRETPYEEASTLKRSVHSLEFRNAAIEELLFLTEILKFVKAGKTEVEKIIEKGDHVRLKTDIDLKNVMCGWPSSCDRFTIFIVDFVYDGIIKTGRFKFKASQFEIVKKA